MLSNKWTFSLKILVVMLTLAFVTPSVIAGEFGVSLSIADDRDVSYEDGYQIQRRRDGQGTLLRTTILVKTDKVVNALPNDAADDILSTGLHYKHFTAIAYNKFGGATVIENTQGSGTESGAQGTIPVVGRPPDGKNFQFDFALPPGSAGDIVRIHIFLEKHKFEVADPRAYLNDDGTRKVDGKNAAASIDFYYVFANGFHNSEPTVYQIGRTGDVLLPVTEPTFDVLITLSEEPKKDTFTKDRFDISNADITKITALGGFAHVDSDNDGTFEIGSTGRDDMIYKYILTVTPKYENKNDIVIKIEDWESQEKPGPEKYTPPTREVDYTEGKDKLTIKVGKEDPPDKDAGIRIVIPEKIVVAASGYLVVGKDDGTGDDNHDARTSETQIEYAGDPTKDPAVTTARVPNLQTYNIIKAGLPNLETFLANGGVIDVVSPHAGLIISEVMWGSDASLTNPTNNQWIELYNPGAKYTTVKEDDATAALEATYLVFYRPNETPPAKTAAVAATATTKAVPAALPAGVTDRIGTIDDKGGYWSIAGKGQSGRTGQGESAGELLAVVPTQPVVSMYRVMVPSTAADAAAGAMMPADGNTSAAWMASTPPAVNFRSGAVGVRIGSPGAGRLVTAAETAAAAAAAKAKADAAAAAAAKASDTSVSMPKVGQIYISELMVAGGGTLPQWIEISNGSRSEEVNLSGWTLTVNNAAADADVSVSSITLTIPEGTKIDPSGQHDTPSTILVVTEQGRNNLSGADAAGQVLNLWDSNQTELILGGITKRRYALLSDMAFQITLAPPVPIVVPAKKAAAPTTAAEIAAARAADAAKKVADAQAAAERAAATDTVGNLGADGAAAWALPMSEDGARSSLIRSHVQVSVGPAEPEDGTMMDNWALASETSFAQVTHIRASSYYGAANDVGTPGFRAGGALPVELSHFRPARQDTGAVVITWSTQSELNNAGFFIKRSQQRDGQFKVINATMVPGAGTSSEKQFYTYTDTTAQPNVVYYYQIEDVSLDGNRQTLTRGIRLKGHVGAAGKATTTWGDLKTSNQ